MKTLVSYLFVYSVFTASVSARADVPALSFRVSGTPLVTFAESGDVMVGNARARAESGDAARVKRLLESLKAPPETDKDQSSRWVLGCGSELVLPKSTQWVSFRFRAPYLSIVRDIRVERNNITIGYNAKATPSEAALAIQKWLAVATRKCE